MKSAFGIFVLLVLLAVPVSFAAAEVSSSNALTSKGESAPGKVAPLGPLVCVDEMIQLQSEATELFGFNPGPPVEVIEQRVIVNNEEIPFGIVAKFANIPFGYGRALPLNEFTHVRGIIVLRKEIAHTKMSGIIYNQEVVDPEPELLMGNLFPAPQTWDADAIENGIWDFEYVAQGKFWTGTYATYLWENWDCSASD